MPENTVRIDRHMPGIWLDRLVHRNPDMFRLGGTLEEASWSSFPGRP